MEFNQLVYFKTLAEIQHVTQAAGKLNMTQPALSNAIGRLEVELGVKLFDRSNRRIILNEYGKNLLDFTNNILTSYDEMLENMEYIKNHISGSFTLGLSFVGRAHEWLSLCICNFISKYPEVQFTQVSGKANELITALEKREIDLAVTGSRITKAGIKWEQLFTDTMGIMLSDKNPLAEKNTISLKDLVNEKFFCNSSYSDSHEIALEVCKDAGFKPNIHFKGDFPEAAFIMINNNQGVSFVSEKSFQQFKTHKSRFKTLNNLIFRPIADGGECRQEFGLAYLQNRSNSRIIQEFRNYLFEYFPKRDLAEVRKQEETSQVLNL